MELNLQQLAAVIDNEDEFVKEVINREFYKQIEFLEEIMGVTVKLLNEPEVQKTFKDEILYSWPMGDLPNGFELSRDLNPLEEVEGGWKWNGELRVDDLEWDNPIFEGKPVVEVTGNFGCVFKDLTSLEGAPQTVGGNFYCNDNNLTSLKGAPNAVGGNFYCGRNKLTSLEGAPETVSGDFDCQNNPDLPKDEIPDTKISGDLYNKHGNILN